MHCELLSWQVLEALTQFKPNHSSQTPDITAAVQRAVGLLCESDESHGRITVLAQRVSRNPTRTRIPYGSHPSNKQRVRSNVWREVVASRRMSLMGLLIISGF